MEKVRIDINIQDEEGREAWRYMEQYAKGLKERFIYFYNRIGKHVPPVMCVEGLFAVLI